MKKSIIALICIATIGLSCAQAVEVNARTTVQVTETTTVTNTLETTSIRVPSFSYDNEKDVISVKVLYLMEGEVIDQGVVTIANPPGSTYQVTILRQSTGKVTKSIPKTSLDSLGLPQVKDAVNQLTGAVGSNLLE